MWAHTSQDMQEELVKSEFTEFYTRRPCPLRNGNRARFQLYRRLQVTGPRQLLIGNCFPVPVSWAAFSGAGSGFLGRAAGGVSWESPRGTRVYQESPAALELSEGTVSGVWCRVSGTRGCRSVREVSGRNPESSGSLGTLAESPGVFLRFWARRAAIGVF